MSGKKRILTLIMAAGLSLGATVNTQSFDLGSLVGAVGNYINENLTEEEKFALITLAIEKLMATDLFKDGNTKEKIEWLKQTIIDTGLVDAETVEAVTDSIMEFEFEGIKIDVLLDYLDYMVYEQKFMEELEQPKDYIESGRTTKKTAQIMYGLGFDSIERQLNYSVDKWTSHGLETSMDNYCTVEDFKTQLSGKDLIIIEEHGNFDYAETPMIVTEEEVTFENMLEQYADDLDYGRVCPVISYDGTRYWLKPSFFEYYYGQNGLNGTIVWIGSCEGNKTNDLVDAFTACGAQAVLAHSESVYTQYDYCILNNTIDEMINGKSMEESVEIAKQNWGYRDVDIFKDDIYGVEEEKPISYPCLTGNITW